MYMILILIFNMYTNNRDIKLIILIIVGTGRAPPRPRGHNTNIVYDT